jgi:hypothetical protein
MYEQLFGPYVRDAEGDFVFRGANEYFRSSLTSHVTVLASTRTAGTTGPQDTVIDSRETQFENRF